MEIKQDETIQAYDLWCKHLGRYPKEGKNLKDYDKYLIPLKQKRLQVLYIIKPICEILGIASFDYKVGYCLENLVIENFKINCIHCTLQQVIQEFIAFAFTHKYVDNRFYSDAACEVVEQLQHKWQEVQHD